MLHIRIKKLGWCSDLLATAEDKELFMFGYDKEHNEWMFCLRGGIVYRYEQRAFPWEYFTDLCRAIYFLHWRGPLYNSADIVSGKSYVK